MDINKHHEHRFYSIIIEVEYYFVCRMKRIPMHYKTHRFDIVCKSHEVTFVGDPTPTQTPISKNQNMYMLTINVYILA